MAHLSLSAESGAALARGTLLGELLPPVVRSAETFGDPAGAGLFAEEEAAVASAVPQRRREFAAVRHCARLGLAQLGYAPLPILPGKQGAPRWPDGVLGSMTHCAGYRAAAVARACDLGAIGIDAEPHGPLPEGALRLIALPEERDAVRRLSRSAPGTHWDRLLFSAKETVYKVWWPLARTWLGFEDALIRLDPAGTFHARILAPGPDAPLRELTGRWLVGSGLAVTAAVQPKQRFR